MNDEDLPHISELSGDGHKRAKEVYLKSLDINPWEREHRHSLVQLGFLSERQAAVRDLVDAVNNLKLAIKEKFFWWIK